MALETGEMQDRALIRDLIENWAIWRDSGDWDRLLTVWHDDGVMVSTWHQSRGPDFVAAAQASWARGIHGQHILGGMAIDLAGDRAIAQTRVTIGQRNEVHGVLVDVSCHGRFYDFLECRDGRWGIVLRQPIYERDRMDPVEPGAALALDPELLAAFPEGYRHLAYLQTRLGMQVRRDLPVRSGPEVEQLYARGRAWLSGAGGHPLDEGYGRS